MKANGAEIIIEMLKRHGIDIIAGIPGGANLPLYHALKRSGIRHVLARHEQGAGFIAQGIARSTGKPGVCFATSGPGATNLLTAVADAKSDSVPLIAITGQVPRGLLGTNAFQEVDTYCMSIPITKHNFQVKSAHELLEVMPRAFRIALADRPGPVLIDVPSDVQSECTEFDAWPGIGPAEPRFFHVMGDIKEVAGMINRASRPVIYAGGGVICSNACSELYGISHKNSIPVVLTLMGLGAFPPDDPLCMGMLGMHAAPSANMLLDRADLLLAFGVRFDDRATGNVEGFCPDARIIHIDIDGSEIDKIKQVNFSITSDVGSVLRELLPHIECNRRKAWVDESVRLKRLYPVPMPERSDIFHPLNVVRTINRLADPRSIVATDVGQHQMWVAQAYRFRHPRTLLTSGGLGTMGFGLPAAIGAALAHPELPIICISGDGSFQMNIQELSTLAEVKGNVTIFILNNKGLGLVRQQQELFYDREFIASKFSTTLDFAAIGRQFGIKGYSLDLSKNPESVIKRALSETGPVIVDVQLRGGEMVLPMVAPGSSNIQMIGGAGDE